MIKIIECPRDAMQGLNEFIPTCLKAGYINSLLKVGFDTIDFGSFVSPKAIPQLSDTKQVVKQLDLSQTQTKLLAIIGNARGAKNALEFDEISYLGFPFSVSDTFLKLNIKASQQQALKNIEHIQQQASTKKKEVVVYVSMAFGNPYGDAYSEDTIFEAVESLKQIGITIINLADTVGMGDASKIGSLFAKVQKAFPKTEIGLHLHTTPNTYYNKIEQAYLNGCRRFDSVMMGMGGCPMSAQKMMGNLSTENLLGFFAQSMVNVKINKENYEKALVKAKTLFEGKN